MPDLEQMMVDAEGVLQEAEEALIDARLRKSEALMRIRKIKAMLKRNPPAPVQVSPAPTHTLKELDQLYVDACERGDMPAADKFKQMLADQHNSRPPANKSDPSQPSPEMLKKLDAFGNVAKRTDVKK